MANFSNVQQTTSASLGSHTFARHLKHPSDFTSALSSGLKEDKAAENGLKEELPEVENKLGRSGTTPTSPELSASVG